MGIPHNTINFPGSPGSVKCLPALLADKCRYIPDYDDLTGPATAPTQATMRCRPVLILSVFKRFPRLDWLVRKIAGITEKKLLLIASIIPVLERTLCITEHHYGTEKKNFTAQSREIVIKASYDKIEGITFDIPDFLQRYTEKSVNKTSVKQDDSSIKKSPNGKISIELEPEVIENAVFNVLKSEKGQEIIRSIPRKKTKKIQQTPH